jgi:hypothetical protein
MTVVTALTAVVFTCLGARAGSDISTPIDVRSEDLPNPPPSLHRRSPQHVTLVHES